jgi:hypothetical protein
MAVLTKLKKYWACYKKANQAAPYTLNINASTVSEALDIMYEKVGTNAMAGMDDEYDLMEIVGPAENQYVPVAQKFKGVSPAAKRTTAPPVINTEVIESKVYAEKTYVSWRDAA